MARNGRPWLEMPDNGLKLLKNVGISCKLLTIADSAQKWTKGAEHGIKFLEFAGLDWNGAIGT